MNKITFPLKRQMRGPQVADLQDALALLLERGLLLASDEAARRELLQALEQQRAEQFYGSATAKLVARFQEERHLQPTGEVDEPTANALNALLKELGLLDGSETAFVDVRYTVLCRLVDARGKPIAGLRVELFHQDPQTPPDPLGEPTTTDAEGMATFHFKRSDFSQRPGERGPDLSFKVFRRDVPLDYTMPGVPASGNVIPNFQPQREPIVLRVERHETLRGLVVAEHGVPAENLLLRLYRREFGGNVTRLAETTTQVGGRYALAYDPGESEPVLEVRAVKADGREVVLTKPLHGLTTEERANLNLVVPADAQPLEAEYRRLVKDLTLRIGQIRRLAEAKENSERQDITVLHRATGWDARLIALTAITERLAADEEVGLPAEGLYGLLRAGLPSDKLLLAQVEPDTVEEALQKVRDAGIVALDNDTIAVFKDQFAAFSSRVRLNLPAPGSASTYRELLDASGLDEPAQRTFASVFLSHRGNGAQLWEEAKKAGLSDVQISKLQLQGKLAFLAGNSAAMTERLLQKNLVDPAALVGQDFHRAEAWKNEVFESAGIPPERRVNLTEADRRQLAAGIPAAYAADTVEARLDLYTEDMARKIRQSCPTQTLTRLMERDEIFKPLVGQTTTLTVLKNATVQGFRLGETPVATFLKFKPEVRGDLTDAEFQAAARELKTVQRLYQITPNHESMPVLMAMGIASAYDVMAYSQGEFIAQYRAKYSDVWKKPAPAGVPELVYRKAEQVSNVTYNLFAIAKQLESSPGVPTLSPAPEVRESVKNELIKHYPTLESLFGSMDFCECEHCRSVLSPAAYFVDLLQFVDIEDQVWANFLAQWKARYGGQEYPHKDSNGQPMKPYDVLIERRPDLPHIALTCENTHTALPYIDIVNEILEYYVANGKLAEDAARDTGGATTAELLAEPQNIIREAYDALAQARYPLTLPFDRWLATVRQFCDYFDTPLHWLLELFRPTDALFDTNQPYARAAVFIESLGLSPVETVLFTQAGLLTHDTWHGFYGFPSVRATIQNPTNTGDATLSVANTEAAKLRIGLLYTFFNTGANALSDESKTLAAIGAPNSGGAGQTVVTLSGTWSTQPTAGDLLVYDVRAMLKSAKALSRRLEVTYKEITEIVQTGFVNPELHRLALLYKLGVGIADARFYRDHKTFYEQNKDLFGKDRSALSPADQARFDALGNKVPDTNLTGWDVLNEVDGLEQQLQTLAHEFSTPLDDLKTAIGNMPFDKVLVLADPDATCDFDRTTLQYADGEKAKPLDFLRINLFVRLWKKLGWSIEETDRALMTFIRPAALVDKDKLPQWLQTALIYLAHLKALDEKLKVGRQSRIKLLTLWADIPTTGRNPLYGQLFLIKSVLKTDPVFDHHLGDYLSTFIAQQKNVEQTDQLNENLFSEHPNISVSYDLGKKTQYLRYKGFLDDAEKEAIRNLLPNSTLLHSLLDEVQVSSRIKGHLLALQGALGLTANDIAAILADAGKSLDAAALSLANVSLLYRYGLLAKGLKLSVRELIALKQLSGLDPFKPLDGDPLTTLDKDHPFSQTLAFVEAAEAVRDSELKIEDLDYLLRHRFDPAGKYRPNRETTLALLKALAEGIRAIRAEHAVPDDPATLSDEVLRQKLGLVLPADVVTRFMAMLNGTVEFTAVQSNVAQDNSLPAEAFANQKSIREVAYNATRQEQRLTFRGVLFDTEKNTLKSAINSALSPAQQTIFANLLDDVQQQARGFFEKHLRRQIGSQPESGFLDDADYDLLFAPTPNSLTETQRQARERQRRTRLAQAFLPFLQQRLIQQFIVQTLTAQTGADSVLVESLLTDERLLKTDGKALLAALEATGERGVGATFFDSADLSGSPQAASPIITSADTSLKDQQDADGNPLNAANSARFEGYLEVATPGAYRFFIELAKQSAEAALRFAHLPEPVFLSGTAAADHDVLGDQAGEFLELKAGVPYRFTLELKNLNGGQARLLVQGERLPKGSLSQLKLYPAATWDAAERALILLNKSLQLIQSLGLNEREIRYILTHAADFGGVNLSELPTALDDNATQRFARFLRLVAYARLKREMAGGSEDLIAVFEANGTKATDKLEKQVYPLIAGITRRDEATVKATAEALFGNNPPAFASEVPLQRLWEALQVVQRFGVPANASKRWTGIVSNSADRFAIARDLRDTIKARFEDEAWQRVAQPIFDKLRQQSRDVLVAHVLNQHGFERLEQLYEYFLIDPGMEPVVQTSRIRLAIASVQLFIQRCLLNLEPKVHPSLINSKQWEWMKRYRVWEANRKIFLFPENWLEPEFRDDKTHLFRELEGALLQSDVSSDLVEDAFFNYLKKLDELARLDIVAMHIEDNPDPARRVLHVFGRTYSSSHKYFYRRYQNQRWTPWEPVNAQIEGDHLAPVVWRDRLYLFWVTFLEKPQQTTDNTPVDPTKKFNIPPPRKDIEAHLHWSEYVNGEWTTRESSQMNVPSPIVVRDVISFDPQKVFVHVSKEYDPDGSELGVFVHLGNWSEAVRQSIVGFLDPGRNVAIGRNLATSAITAGIAMLGTRPTDQAFYLAGRNSSPEAKDYAAPPINPFSANTKIATRYTGSSAFTVSFSEKITTESDKTPQASPVPKDILGQGSTPGRIVETKETKYFVIQERTLSYRFFLHQHPYVQPLMQRLLRKGTSGLQAADTEYQTRVRLSSSVAAKDSSGRSVQLAKDELVYLVDGATVILDGDSVRFAGSKVLRSLDDGVVTPPANKRVTIPAQTAVRRVTGEVVTLNANAAATLIDGGPLPVLYAEIFSKTQYNPSPLVQTPYPIKDLDFTSGGAYAVYNWELFFHVPFTIAVHLSKNGRYAEAQRWFHYLFDPTDDSDGPTPERFWKVRPFQSTDVKKIEEILVNLATGADPDLRNETLRSIEAWKDAPFRPHVIARYRQQAYMYKTVMAYLDNLIAWGDSLFRQDTGEAIDEALQLYGLAANILGPRPQAVPKKGSVRPQTYANLQKDLQQFGVVLREVEADIPFDLGPFPDTEAKDADRLTVVRGLGKALYFCVPRNDKLLNYWDAVADRLFKIRNSLNIQGVFRQLALFEPPIDPALLARAAAAGLDVGAIVNGLNQPLPLVRFAFLVQKAAEIAQEVKLLSNQLLSAMEKEDGEALALLRAKHERAILQMVEQVKYAQLQEAIKAKEGLLQSLALAVQRYTYYERQLGKKPDEIEKAIPQLDELDKDSLAKLKFAMQEPALEPQTMREIKVDIAQDLGESGGKIISSYERDEFLRLKEAQQLQEEGASFNMIAKFLALIPEFGAQAQPMGVGAAIQFGGRALSTQLSLAADASNTSAGRKSYQAGKAARIGSYARREQEWTFQSNLAAGEINQIFKQLRAAQIREAIAEQELESHRKQMKHAEEIERFLNEEGTEKTGKRTNKALYTWMKREVRGLYAQCFQFAFDIARKVERALQHELGNPELSYLQFGYLAGKEGLLAGERLYLDIKRMEMAYHEQNRREYELTKHVSLLQVDPLALIQLRTTGRCTVRLPEMLFDMDGPGHYFRRIKSAALSIPCVTGPYAGVNCKLTLLKSSIRKTPILSDGEYARQGSEDDRFSDHFGSLESIVVSSAQNDSGLFETNLRDERYLPFENFGVICECLLELPAHPSQGEPAQFDYDTISDVILHIRYTAREGGALLRNAALAQIKALIERGEAAGSVRLFSVRHEFPGEWAKFKSQTPGSNQRYELALTLRPEHYPFWAQGRLNKVSRVDLLARSAKTTMTTTEVADNPNTTAKKDELNKDDSLGNLFVGKLTEIALPQRPTGELKLYFNTADLDDLWLAMTWSG